MHSQPAPQQLILLMIATIRLRSSQLNSNIHIGPLTVSLAMSQMLEEAEFQSHK